MSVEWMMSGAMVERVGWTLVHSLWIGAAAGVLHGGLMVALRRGAARVRYGVSCAVLGLFMMGVVGAFVMVGGAGAGGKSGDLRSGDGAGGMGSGSAMGNAGRGGGTGLGGSMERGGVSLGGGQYAVGGGIPPKGGTTKLPPEGGTTYGGTTNWGGMVREAVEPGLPWVVGMWGCGVGVLGVWQFGGWVGILRMRRGARVVEAGLRARVGELARRMGVRRVVGVMESALVRVPTVMGWLKPVILLPVGFALGLSAGQVEAILVHELAHIRRHDYLVNMVQTLVETVLFYHPATWAISRRIRREREHCCDDAVVALGADERVYAESLLEVARQSTLRGGAGLGMGATGSSGKMSELRMRIMRLVGEEGTGRGRHWPVVLAAGLVVVGMVLGMTLRAQAPVARVGNKPDATLTIEMAPQQPSNAPVIFYAHITNTSDRDLRDAVEQNIGYQAYLTGPDNQSRRVAVTNGTPIQGSGPKPSFKPGESHRTPLRLTNYTAEWCDYLPSEKVFLAPGKYQLRLVHILPGSTPPTAPDTVEATTTFTVVDDPAPAKARWDELKNPAKGEEAFAKHVLETTLTPEIRKSWYAEILKDEPARTGFKVYALSSIQDPPADVVPAMLEIFENQLDRFDPTSREQCGILNNAAQFLGNHLPAGAGEAFLKCALSQNAPSADQGTQDTLNGARTMSFEAVRHYWQDSMADKIAAALSSKEKWIPIYAARLLAWAGDERGAEVLIAAAKNKNAFAAGGLAYLPNHRGAAEAFKEALASTDGTFAKELRQVLAEQAPARRTTATAASDPPNSGAPNGDSGSVTRYAEKMLTEALSKKPVDVAAVERVLELAIRVEAVFEVRDGVFTLGGAVATRPDPDAKEVRLVRELPGTVPTEWLAILKAPLEKHPKVMVLLTLGVPEELRGARNKALAEADRALTTGLVKLGEQYPFMKKARDWQSVTGRAAFPAEAERLGVWLSHSNGGKGGTSEAPVPEGETYGMIAVLERPQEENGQLAMHPTYPGLGLEGQTGAQAGNPALDAELKKLLAQALAPLGELDMRATRVLAGKLGMAMEKAGATATGVAAGSGGSTTAAARGAEGRSPEPFSRAELLRIEEVDRMLDPALILVDFVLDEGDQDYAETWDINADGTGVHTRLMHSRAKMEAATAVRAPAMRAARAAALKLPASGVVEDPLHELVVAFKNGEQWEVREYDRRKLPTEVSEWLAMLNLSGLARVGAEAMDSVKVGRYAQQLLTEALSKKPVDEGTVQRVLDLAEFVEVLYQAEGEDLTQVPIATTMPDGEARSVVLSRETAGKAPAEWMAILKAPLAKRPKVTVIVVPRVPEELRKERNAALAQAEQALVKGLAELGAKYPFMKKATGWEDARHIPTEREGLFLSVYRVRDGVAEVPAGEGYQVMVMLSQAVEMQVQMPSELVWYMSLGLTGETRATADDPELAAALKALVKKALAPVAEVDERAARVLAGKLGMAVGKAGELAPILPDLASADFARREAGQKALEQLPADRYEMVAAVAAEQTDPEVKARLDARAAQMLVELTRKPTPASTRALLGLLTEKDEAIRDRAILALSDRIGISADDGGSDQVLPALAKILPDVKDERVRVTVCTSANQYLKPWAPAKKPDAKRGPQAAEMLRERLKNDPSAEVRLWAACGLAEFGDNSGLPELEKDTLAMQASGDGKLFGTGDNFFWVNIVVPPLEKATGQKFEPKPVELATQPNLMLHQDLAFWAVQRAKLDMVVAWIKAHPSTEAATTRLTSTSTAGSTATPTATRADEGVGTTTRAGEVPWGEAVEGVQLRLTPGRSAWRIPVGVKILALPGTEYHYIGEEPVLTLEVRNGGQLVPEVGMAQPGYLMEFDGKAYEFIGHVALLSTRLEPGKSIGGIGFPIKSAWQPELPELAPGKHTVRAIYHLSVGAGPAKEVFSNAATVEVMANVGAATRGDPPKGGTPNDGAGAAESEGVTRYAEKLLTEALSKRPVDEGALRRVLEAVISVEVGYGVEGGNPPPPSYEVTTRPDPDGGVVRLLRADPGKVPEEWISMLEAPLAKRPKVWAGLMLGVPAELRQQRDEALAKAERDLRTGLAGLGEEYPFMKNDGKWADRIAPRAAEPEWKGTLSFQEFRMSGEGKLGSGAPEAEAFGMMVVLQPPQRELGQMGTEPVYPCLGLDGHVGGQAGNVELDGKIKKLLVQALVPLGELDMRAARVWAGKLGMAVEKAGADGLGGLSDSALLESWARAALAAGATDAPLAQGNPAEYDEATNLAKMEILRRGGVVVPGLMDMLRAEVAMTRPMAGGSNVRPSLAGLEIRLLTEIRDLRSTGVFLELMLLEESKVKSDIAFDVRAQAASAMEQVTFEAFHKVKPHYGNYAHAVENAGALATDWYAAADYPQAVKLYRAWLAGEGKDSGQWLALAGKRARDLLEGADLDAAYCAASFLSNTGSRSSISTVNDDNPERTVQRLGQILSNAKRVEGTGDYQYQGKTLPVSLANWVNLLANYGPRARPWASTLIRFQNETALNNEWGLEEMVRVGGKEIMAYWMEALPKISAEADRIVNDPNTPKSMLGSDPRLAWLGAQRECRRGIERWAGQIFDTDAQREAWWKAHQDKTAEQWLRDSWAELARQADVPRAAAEVREGDVNPSASAYLFREVFPDAPYGTDEAVPTEAFMGTRGTTALPYRAKWVEEHRGELKYDAATGTFRLAGAAEVAWGEAVEGVQLRLTPGEMVWQVPEGADLANPMVIRAADRPMLKLEMRNVGEGEQRLDIPYSLDLEYDGVICHAPGGGRGQTFWYKAGESGSVELWLSQFRMPAITVGKHKVRVLQVVQGVRKAVSNMVTVEIRDERAGRGAATRGGSDFDDLVRRAMGARAVDQATIGDVRGKGTSPTGLDFAGVLAESGEAGDYAAFPKEHVYHSLIEATMKKLVEEKKIWVLAALLNHESPDAQIDAARGLTAVGDGRAVAALLAAAKANNYDVSGSENMGTQGTYRGALKKTLEELTGLALTPKGLHVVVNVAPGKTEDISSDEHPERFVEVDFGKVEKWLGEKYPVKAGGAGAAGSATGRADGGGGTTTRAGEVAWGEAVEGVKVRLTVDGKTGLLRMEARNEGVRENLQVGATEHSLELEVDGKWYRWEPAKGGDQLLAFGRGAELKDVAVTLTGSWEEKKEGEVYVGVAGYVDMSKRAALALKEGKHKVRVAVYAVPRAHAGELVRAVSNGVEVEAGAVARSAPATGAGATTKEAERLVNPALERGR